MSLPVRTRPPAKESEVPESTSATVPTAPLASPPIGLRRREAAPAHAASPSRAYRPNWALIFVVWTGVGLISTEQSYITLRLAGRAVSWERLLMLELSSVWLWALFTPPIVWWSRRHHVDRQTWRAAVPLHVAAAAALSAVDVTLDRALAPWLLPGPPQPLVAMFVGQLTVNLFSYFAVVATRYAADYRSMWREREVAAANLAAQLATAHLRALQAQLQPHFLFNTLNAIAELVHVEPDTADLMIARLGALLRQTFETTGRHEVALGEELRLLETYLDIVRMRHRGRLAVTLDIDPAALAARVPTMLLQPLVENSVRHGIEPTTVGGRIEVLARAGTDTLVLEVRDDGRGVEWNAVTSREGVGLRNTRARLGELYGDRARLDVRARDGGGLVVAITLPLLQADSPPHDQAGIAAG